jgi:hypothetical protein
MRNGLLRLVRGLAVFGMAMAFMDFTLGVINWITPHNQRYYTSSRAWFGKRMTDAMNPPPNAAGTQSSSVTPERLQGYFRSELDALYNEVRASSQWFLLASVVYLLARRQIRDEAPPDADD